MKIQDFPFSSSGLWNIQIFGILFGCCWCAIFSISVSIVDSGQYILFLLSLLHEEEKLLFWVMLFNFLSNYFWVAVFFVLVHVNPYRRIQIAQKCLILDAHLFIVFEFTRYFQGGKKILLHFNTMQDKRWTFYVMQMIAYIISFNDRVIIYSIIQNLFVIHLSEYISAEYCNNIGCAYRHYISSSLNKWWMDSFAVCSYFA